jgi:MFS transporter, SP family, sugar:H+ symporter
MDQFVEHYGSYDSATGNNIITASTQSLVTSIINSGEFVGALTASLISDHTGLRGGLLIATVTVAIGTTLQIAGTYIGLLIVGRLVLGKYH